MTEKGTVIGREWQIPAFSEEEGQRRWKKTRELMMDREIDCLLVAGSTFNCKAAYSDIRYLTNAIPWWDDSYLVFPIEGDPVLYVWSMHIQYWNEKVSWVPIVHCERYLTRKNYPELIADKVKDLGLEKGSLGIVNKYIWFIYTYERVKELLPSAKFVEAGEVLRAARRVKSPAELEYVRKAGECADMGWEAMLNVAKPGVTEYELVAECERAMVRNGAELGSFTLLNSKQWPDGYGFPHGGSYRKLQQGDIIINEITPCYGGYFVQLVRPISLGTPPDDYIELLNINKGMYRIAYESLRAGNVAQEISDKATDWALAQGRPLSAARPSLQLVDSILTTPTFMGELKAGMVFVNHPWTAPPQADITARKGHMGHMIGNTLIITEGEPECVSKFLLELTVV